MKHSSGRDRAAVLAGIAAILALAWAYTLAGAGMGMSAFDMTAMTPSPGQPGMAMPSPRWTPFYALVMFAMWWVMMIAMMLPSAAPMILVFAGVHRQQGRNAGTLAPVAVFAAAYLLVWGAFSVAATAAQWALATNALISPMLLANTPLLAAGILIAAGVYQLTPWKQACLAHCRAPVQFIATRWRPGTAGALRMGMEHGALCLGCCWALMALLFVGGVMNLYWIAGLALWVLVEKLLPRGRGLSHAAGVALIAGGLVLLWR